MALRLGTEKEKWRVKDKGVTVNEARYKVCVDSKNKVMWCESGTMAWLDAQEGWRCGKPAVSS